ncbi:MAG: sensor histidine kinase [Balneolaceae bacterium]|nr:MAG: sensor histidine kinase [Balneolaceae bacterium]
MSLKIKIIFYVGLIIAFLMMIISIAFLYQFRSVILEKEISNARSVSSAAAIPILDAFIFSEQDFYDPSQILERHISYFMANVNGMKFMHVYNRGNKLTASTHWDPATPLQARPPEFRVTNTVRESVSIHRHDEYGWVIEIEYPLFIAGKYLGTTVMGFDGNPVRKEIRSLFIGLLILNIVVTTITLYVLYKLISKLTRSLGQLTDAIDQFDLKTPEKKLPLPDSDDEIGHLGKRFGLLQQRLIESKHNLAESQRNIYRAEKLAFIGRLSSGVAHEINNSVNGIQSCMYAINKDPKNHEQTEEYMKLISEGLQHIEIIVKKLLEYSRKNSPSLVNVNIAEIVENVLKLCSYKIQKLGITITFKPDTDLPGIKADKYLIQEVLMNLLINSMDAVSDGGCICIKAGRKNRQSIYLSVEDDGPGIAPEFTDLIFEPFFTTKDTGKGTGLGLSVVQGVVESHDGTIRLDSQPGVKTVFTITLPINGKHERTIN